MAQKSTPSSRADDLTDAMLAIVREDGIEGLSVRAVAARAGVSIGTVQHYFRTKEAMLVAAFAEVVDRVRARLDAITWTDDPAADLQRVLEQLVPLDRARADEARVMLAFAAASATAPSLAEIQAATLDAVHAGLALGFARVAREDAPSAASKQRARLACATVDGLTLDAISAGRAVDARVLRADLKAFLAAVTNDWAVGRTGRLGRTQRGAP